MSTYSDSTESSDRGPKFTRGEKCIFTHLIITFSVILLLVITYLIHLAVVNHTLRNAWKVSRRTSTKHKFVGLDTLPVGLIYLSQMPLKYACNSLLLRDKWSVGPGHCAAMRTDPDLSHLLLSWRVKYRGAGSKFIGSDIKRTIPHPHFDRDDFQNNIGLFEHGNVNGILPFVFPTNLELNDDTLQAQTDTVLVGWSHNSTIHEGERPHLRPHFVKTVPITKCIRFMSPILDLRIYEFCVLLEQKTGVIPEHGSVFVADSTILGFFSWGEKTGKGTPCVVIDLKHFQVWLENIIAW